MILLIDANILLDVLKDRKPHVKESSIIWKLCETRIAKGYVSSLTFANLVYILRKELTPDKVEEVYQFLSLIFEFVELNSSDLAKAASLKWNDFEDAIQSILATKVQADYIITRNVRDFTQSKVIALTPSEYLQIS